MKYTITKWTIKTLNTIYKQGKLNLSPPYQRNFIWDIEDQQTLVESINKQNPIPNFFLLKEGENYEMVDGQQRSRTMLSFIDGQFEDEEGYKYSQTRYKNFMKYSFPVTIIIDREGESIEKFYAMVNKTGIHVNKPEIRQADFYNTNLLKLINDIASSSKFKLLKLFTSHSLKRMNDSDFISELVVLIKAEGHVDKKGHIDEYFESDLSLDECSAIKIKFLNALDKIAILDNEFSINKSRYKQRNDFYTLFDFILNNPDLENEVLIYFYRVLLLISKDIKPTQDKCIPLKDYATNCVTQSNSKTARDNRLKFFNELLLNTKPIPNKVQKAIMKFKGFKANKLHKINKYYTLDIELFDSITDILYK